MRTLRGAKFLPQLHYFALYGLQFFQYSTLAHFICFATKARPIYGAGWRFMKKQLLVPHCFTVQVAK